MGLAKRIRAGLGLDLVLLARIVYVHTHTDHGPSTWPCHYLDSSLGLPYPLTVGYVWGRCGVKARADHCFGTSQGSKDVVECNIYYSAILDYAYEAY